MFVTEPEKISLQSVLHLGTDKTARLIKQAQRLRQEIVQLSTRFRVLSDHTALLK